VAGSSPFIGEGGDGGALEGESADGLGEGEVVADEHPDLAEASLEDREVVAGTEDGPLELVVELAEDADDALGADEDGGVVDQVAVHRALGEAGLDQHVVASGELGQAVGGGAGDRLGDATEVGKLLGHVTGAEGAGAHQVALEGDLGEDEVVDAAEGGLVDEGEVLLPIGLGVVGAVHGDGAEGGFAGGGNAAVGGHGVGSSLRVVSS
jgi:hypothetical protein